MIRETDDILGTDRCHLFSSGPGAGPAPLLLDP